MWPAGHIQREVAVAVVIAVEETPLLPAVQRVVGRVHIQDDLLRRRGVAVQEQLHQQRVEPLRVGHDALVAVLRGLLGGAQLEPVEGARAGQRMAPVVVAEVLIPQRQPEQALGQQALQGMLAAAGVAVIDEAGGQAPGQADALVDSLQQQGATIGGHAAAVKTRRALGGSPDWPDRL